MGKRTKKGRKSNSKSKATGNPIPEEDLAIQPDPLLGLRTLNILDPLAKTGGSQATDNNSTTAVAPFGFDSICNECKRLYDLGMSRVALDAIQAPKVGLYVGSLAHISPNSSCSMCRSLFEMRWSTSETSQYHLHAFSAARMVYGRSIQHLRASLSENGVYSLEDSALFAVVADCSEPVSTSLAVEGARKGFLIASRINLDGKQLPPEYVRTEHFKEDDRDQYRWIEYTIHSTIGKRDKYTRVPIKMALQQARQMGFIYEYKTYFYFRLRDCRSTSILELEERQASGEKHIDYMVLQPMETGDPNSQRNLGYVPHEVRTSETPPIQSLQSAGFFGRPLNTATIDYSLLRGWIRQCQKRCDLRKFIGERKRFQRIHFCLLDCKKREIIKAPAKRHLKYIALSYVWGDTDMSSRPCVTQLPFSVSERCSAVIEDAMTVVLELGYRYLWVDSFCISPDASLKHEQIANMDVVYKNAELTIVAAAGSNADYGLPGVGTRQRIPQTQIRIGKHHYVATTTELDHWLNASTYQTRGWTYQEFFFSRRKLIFSDFQVSFECRSLCSNPHQQESLICPPHQVFKELKNLEQLEEKDPEDAYLDKVPIQWKDAVYETDGTIQYREASQIDKVFTLVSYEHHVSQFTKRRLSFEGDSLQAVSSILDRFTYQSHSIFHLHGLPYIPQSVTYLESGQSHQFKFKYGLLWTHGPLNTPTRRRAAFPSWSWTGWEGPVNWLVNTTDIQNFVESADVAAKFEILCSATGKRSQICSVDSWRPSQHGNFHPEELRFAAHVSTIPLRIQERISDAERGIYLDSPEPFTSRLHVTQIGLDSEDIAKKQFYGIWLGVSENISVNYMLVVQPTTPRSNRFGGKYYERVGVMMISRSWPGWNGQLGVQGCLV